MKLNLRSNGIIRRTIVRRINNAQFKLGRLRRSAGLLRRIFPERVLINREQAVVTVTSTLLLIIDDYRRLTPFYYLDRLLLYLVIPLVVIVLFQRRRPAEYGFGWGDWRIGLILTAAGIVLMTPVILYLAFRVPAMQSYYQHGNDWWIIGKIGLDLIGWEFIFRGWILFSYAKKYGPDALWLQAVPFALAHLGKPELETLSTIFGGFAFGWIAWRTRSFVYPLLIHWYIAVLISAASSGLLGL